MSICVEYLLDLGRCSFSLHQSSAYFFCFFIDHQSFSGATSRSQTVTIIIWTTWWRIWSHLNYKSASHYSILYFPFSERRTCLPDSYPSITPRKPSTMRSESGDLPTATIHHYRCCTTWSWCCRSTPISAGYCETDTANHWRKPATAQPSTCHKTSSSVIASLPTGEIIVWGSILIHCVTYQPLNLV